MCVHVSPILNPPPTSLPIPFLRVVQCPSFKCPVSCIELGLVIYFTYANIHVSMLFSQIILPLPSPTESKSLLISVSFLLSRKYIYIYIYICCRKGDPFQGLKLASCLTLGNELSEETHVLTKQEILLGKGTRVESSRVREPRKTALQSQVLW